MIPTPGQDLIAVGAAVVGAGGDEAFLDGAAEGARFAGIVTMLRLPDGRVLVADIYNHRIRALSADLQQVSTVAGCGPAGAGSAGHQDGAAALAQFSGPCGLALLPDGRVLVAGFGFNGIRMLSADLQQVSTVAGDGEQGYQDGAAAQATFFYPRGMAVLPDGRVLVADGHNHSIRMLSANLQQVTTVAGDGDPGHRDGGAAQAQFRGLYELVVLPNGCVLVADIGNCCIRMLSVDLQDVSTLAGDAPRGCPRAPRRWCCRSLLGAFVTRGTARWTSTGGGRCERACAWRCWPAGREHAGDRRCGWRTPVRTDTARRSRARGHRVEAHPRACGLPTRARAPQACRNAPQEEAEASVKREACSSRSAKAAATTSTAMICSRH